MNLTQFLKHSLKAMLFSVVITTGAAAAELTLAGLSFAGDYKTAKDRFPYTFAIYDELNKSKTGERSLSYEILSRAKTLTNPSFEFKPLDTLTNLKNDQALMTTLVITGETVSSENFGSYYKSFVNLRGDVLIFDYKNKTVVRSYPISVIIFDATKSKPTQQDIASFVKSLLTREDGIGLISQYLRRIGTATLPVPGTRNVQIKNAEVAPEALALLPEALRNDPKIIEAMVSDAFGSIIAAKLGVPVLPNAIGHTLGTMSLRLENGDDIVLKIGEGDYLFDIKLTKLAKIKNGENNVGKSFVYGAYANIHFYEPSLNTDFFNSDLKNGEVKLLPAGQLTSEDFPSFEAAIRGLFLKFADAIQNKDNKESTWITTAASAANIKEQVIKTREIIKATK